MNKDKTIPKLWDNKVDKGGYTGTAQNLKSEIDSKVSKSGDIMTGSLTIKTEEANQIQLYRQGVKIGEIVGGNNYIGIYTSGTDFTHKFMSDGTVKIQDKSLATQSKEVIGAINELYNNSFMSKTRINELNYNDGDYFREIIKQGKPGSYYTGNTAIHGLPVGIPNYRNLLFSSTADVYQAFLGQQPFNDKSTDLYYTSSTTSTDIKDVKWVKIWHSGVMSPTVIQVNGIMGTTSNLNPAERAVGTTWTRIGEQNVGGTTVYYWKRNS